MLKLQNTRRKTYNTTWLILASGMCHHCKYSISVKFYVILGHDWGSCIKYFHFCLRQWVGLELWLYVKITQGNKKRQNSSLEQCQGPFSTTYINLWGRRAGHPVFRGLQMIPSGWESLGHGVLCTIKAQLLLMRAVFVFGTTASNILP